MDPRISQLVMAPSHERMVPESATSGTFWEHVFRYRFAMRYVRGKRVLDVACGEGYGTKAIQEYGACDVIGIDASQEACDHARRKYDVDARVGDAMHLPFPDVSFDVIVSFETVEHLADPERFLSECARVLAPAGTVVISTPNAPVYDPSGGSNPYHLSEMDEKQFRKLLGGLFPNIEFYSQSIERASAFSFRYLCSRRNIGRRLSNYAKKRIAAELPEGRFRSTLLATAPAEKDPVVEIRRSTSVLQRLFNPMVVRPRRESAHEEPMMLVAVCRKK